MKRFIPAFSILIFSFMLVSCSVKSSSVPEKPAENAEADSIKKAQLAKLQTAYFAGGCFWCVEGVFESITGVSEVISGYSGGDQQNPTYQNHEGDKVSHAEAVEVYYDSSVVSFQSLLKVYFACIDPTQVNGQGPDRGASYRSIVFYKNAAEKNLTETFIKNLTASKKYSEPIAVEVKAFDKFWKAEDYHQDYIRYNPNNPYVQHESIPRIKRTQAAVPELVNPAKKL